MIEALTDPGEQLIWSGNPDPARYALRKAGSTFLFGSLFFGASIMAMLNAYPSNSSGQMILILFVLFGACLVLSPVWYFFRGMWTTYALTNRRAIIDLSRPFPERTSVLLHQIPFVDVRCYDEGPGHVLFQEALAGYSAGFRSIVRQRDGFVAIADATKVGYMLRSAIENSVRARLSKP
jgi:hypothetical protein